MRLVGLLPLWGPLPAFQTSAAPSAVPPARPPRPLAQPLTASSPGGPSSRSRQGEQGCGAQRAVAGEDGSLGVLSPIARVSVALCGLKVSRLLDGRLVREWAWGLGGAEAVGRNQGGARGLLGHPWRWVRKLTVLSPAGAAVIPSSRGHSASWLW